MPNWSAVSNSPSGTTSAALGPNLLTNGSFETGSLSSWTVGSGAFSVVSTTPQDGTYRVSYPGAAGDQTLYQGGIALTAGTQYTLTAYYRVDTASVTAEGWRYAEIGIYANSGPAWGVYLARATIDDNTVTSGWRLVTITYTPASNMTVSVGFANWQTDAVYALDNFSLAAQISGGADSTAPGTVNNLAAGTPTSTSLTLSWTAPGDDGNTGTATTYDVRCRTGGAVDTTNWAAATQATGEPTPHAAGTGETFVVNGLTANTTYWFGLETADEVPNWSAISNSPSNTTSPPDTTPPATVSNLATSTVTSTSITLTWTAPGDDGTTGTATTYDVRYRTGGTVVTTNWAAASQAGGETTPKVAGQSETFTVGGLASSTTYYFGLETADEVPNWSAFPTAPAARPRRRRSARLDAGRPRRAAHGLYGPDPDDAVDVRLVVQRPQLHAGHHRPSPVRRPA